MRRTLLDNLSDIGVAVESIFQEEAKVIARTCACSLVLRLYMVSFSVCVGSACRRSGGFVRHESHPYGIDLVILENSSAVATLDEHRVEGC